jgi:hypothetical protein
MMSCQKNKSQGCKKSKRVADLQNKGCFIIDWDKVDPDNNVTITQEGNVAGEQAGTAIITAIFDGREASANVNVADADDGIDITVEIASNDDSNGQIRVLYDNGAVLCGLSDACPLDGIHPASKLTLEAVPDTNTAGEDIANFIDWFGPTTSYYATKEQVTIDKSMDKGTFTANFHTPMTTIDLQVAYNGGSGRIYSLSYKIWRNGELNTGDVCGYPTVNCSIEVPKKIGKIRFNPSPLGNDAFEHWSGACSGWIPEICEIDPSTDDDSISLTASFIPGGYN